MTEPLPEPLVPEDDLEMQIKSAMDHVFRAKDCSIAERADRWKSVVSLISKRSPQQVARMERAMRMLHDV